jgi:hypothetical protein
MFVTDTFSINAPSTSYTILNPNTVSHHNLTINNVQKHKPTLQSLSKSQPQSISHGTIHLNLYHSLGGLHTSGFGRCRGRFGRLVILLYDGGIDIVQLNGFGTDNVLI